jgi:transmembrane sensor
MDRERLQLLFGKYIRKTASDAERQELLQLIAQLEEGDTTLEQISSLAKVPESPGRELPEDMSRQILEAILVSEKAEPASTTPPRRIIWLPCLAAAAVLLFAIGVWYLYLLPKKPAAAATIVSNAHQIINDVLPGKSGAVLALSTGQTFLLDTIRNGVIAAGIVKSSEVLDVHDTSFSYATLSTPPGRQQQLHLSDGTKVWLNAGSSIRFATLFNAKERVVEVTGEVYFEVLHDAARPFIVRTNTDEIRDIGTRFNINAYSNEGVNKITLAEGSIRINDRVILKPDEQYAGGKVSAVNAENSMAWVSGYFAFDHTDIRTVMRQMARWYNVEVHFEGQVTAKQFEGRIQRSLTLSEVMELLSGTGIHYAINGNQLTIK